MIKKDIHNLNLDVISEVAFGYSTHAIDNLELEKLEKPENVTMTLREALLNSLEAMMYLYIFGKFMNIMKPIPKIRKLINVRNLK